MSSLNHREHTLVALGAAMGSNCVPCIEHHIREAGKAGFDDRQIREIIAFADKVRKVPAAKVLDTAHRMLPRSSADAHTMEAGGTGADSTPESACGCQQC